MKVIFIDNNIASANLLINDNSPMAKPMLMQFYKFNAIIPEQELFRFRNQLIILRTLFYRNFFEVTSTIFKISWTISIRIFSKFKFHKLNRMSLFVFWLIKPFEIFEMYSHIYTSNTVIIVKIVKKVPRSSKQRSSAISILETRG